MGSVSSSVTAPLTLNGVSQYSSDLQNILNRAVQIQQVPVQQLQNHDSDILQEKSLWTGIQSAVGDLATSLTSLQKLASTNALSATSSNTSVVTAQATGATSASTYTIDSVTSTASAASERTTASFGATQQVSQTGNLELDIGTQKIDFSLTTNTLAGLRDQIIGLNAGVSASILTTPTGNYLSVTANNTGATTLALKDIAADSSKTNLLTSSNQGTDAVFELNGLSIDQASNTVNSVIPGVSLTLQGTSSTAVTVSLATDRSSLGSALSDVATKYKAVEDQLNAQVGPNAGQLSGNPVVGQLRDALRSLVSDQGTGSIANLQQLGLEFDNSGNVTFNQTTLDGLTDSDLQSAFSWLGSATSGIGGFATELTGYSDPVTGIIKSEQDGLDQTDKDLQSQIQTLNDRISSFQTNLQSRLQAADAAIAELQSQQSLVNASIQGLNLVLYGKDNTNTTTA